MKNTKIRIILILVFLSSWDAYSQNNDQLPGGKFFKHYVESVSSKARVLDQRLDKQADKAIYVWQQREARLIKKWSRKDSIKGHLVFKNTADQYQQLSQRLQEIYTTKKYIPSLDSLNSSLKFFQQNQKIFPQNKDRQERVKVALGKLKDMDSRFQKAESIKQFSDERKNCLQSSQGNLALPGN